MGAQEWKHLRQLTQQENSTRVCGPVVVLDLDKSPRKTGMGAHVLANAGHLRAVSCCLIGLQLVHCSALQTVGLSIISTGKPLH